MPDNATIENVGVTPDLIIKQRYPASEELKRLNNLYSRHKEKHLLSTGMPEDMDTLRLNALKKDHQVLSACNMLLLLTQAPKNLSHVTALQWLKKNYVVPTLVQPQLL
jgi:hypothetical protein